MIEEYTYDSTQERQQENDLRDLYEDVYCGICDARCITVQERAAGRCSLHLETGIEDLIDDDVLYHGE